MERNDGEVARHVPWPFPGDSFPGDLGAVVQRTVLSGELPARLVIHDDENDWCAGDDVNDPDVPGASVIAHMTHVLARDSSVSELASLPPGWAAVRTGPRDGHGNGSAPVPGRVRSTAAERGPEHRSRLIFAHAAFGSIGGTHRAADGQQPYEYGRYKSQASGGAKEGAREPAQLQTGQLSRREPGELAELAITRCRGTCDDPGFIDRGDVGRAVAVGVADLVIGAAEHVDQADQMDVGADLLAGLPDRCRGGRLAHVHGAAEDAPPVVMAGVADQQHPACPVDGQDRHRRQEQQLMPDDGSQPGICAAIPTWVTLRPGGGQPRAERVGSVTGPDSARTGLFTAG
jgi:hypothetical protein